MKILTIVLKNIFLFILVLLLTYITAMWFYIFYSFLFNVGDSFVDARIFIGMPFSYIFFLAILFTAFGDKHKYWWMAILLFPAVFFEVYFDLFHIYFPIALGLLGWVAGLMIVWAIGKFKIAARQVKPK